MFFIKSIYCRIFQKAFRIALPFLPYREPKIINSCEKVGSILKKENIKSVLIVTDKGIAGNGLIESAKESVKKSGIFCAVYDETQANPTVINVEAALEVYYAHNCNGIIAIGGGCINDVVVHLATSEMGFGGVGESGMGSYHGSDGFSAFSHYKSVMIKKHGLICLCVISRINISFMKSFCICF